MDIYKYKIIRVGQWYSTLPSSINLIKYNIGGTKHGKGSNNKKV